MARRLLPTETADDHVDLLVEAVRATWRDEAIRPVVITAEDPTLQLQATGGAPNRPPLAARVPAARYGGAVEIRPSEVYW